MNADGTLYVLAVGLDHALWVTHSTDGTHWSGWRSLGGWVTGDIAAATPAPGFALAFARGADNAAWYKSSPAYRRCQPGLAYPRAGS